MPAQILSADSLVKCILNKIGLSQAKKYRKLSKPKTQAENHKAGHEI